MQQAFRHVHGIFRREESRMDPCTTQHVHVVLVFGRFHPLFRRILVTCVAFQPPFHELLSQLGVRRTSGFPEPLQRRHLRRTRLRSFSTKRTRLASRRTWVRTGRTARHSPRTCDVRVHPHVRWALGLMEPWSVQHDDAEAAMVAAEGYVQRWQSERRAVVSEGHRTRATWLQKTNERYVDVDVTRTKQADRHFRKGATWLAQGRVDEAFDALERARDACPKGDVQAEEKIARLLQVAEAERKRMHGREGARNTHDEADVRSRREAKERRNDQ